MDEFWEIPNSDRHVVYRVDGWPPPWTQLLILYREYQADDAHRDGDWIYRLMLKRRAELEGIQDERSSEVSEGLWEAVWQLVSKEPMPAIAAGLRGMDGTTHELMVKCDMSRSQFSWWLEVPEAWLPLGKAGDLLSKAARDLLGAKDRWYYPAWPDDR